jgi:hypothetical protein
MHEGLGTYVRHFQALSSLKILERADELSIEECMGPGVVATY